MKRNSILLLLMVVSLLQAQVEISGSVDLLLSRSGKDSRVITNYINNDFTNSFVSIRQFNLFFFSQISEEISFESRLQFDD
jgi:hypothetical protein